jgi:hypothetical protein
VRYPYPGGVGVPRLGRPCRSRSLSLVIRIPLSTQSKGTKVVLAENFSEEKFDAEGASPFLDLRRPLGPGPLRRAWLWPSGPPGPPEPWPPSSVPGPKVCSARSVTLFLSPFFSLRLKNFIQLSTGFDTALNESVKNCKPLAQAVEQKEADRAAMSEAISAFCQAFGLDGIPSGSSPQSHMWALGGHVRSRLRGALHHDVRRAFAVLASHYDMDLERVSEGYCLPDEEEAALAEVQRLDAAVEGPSATLASSFEVEILPPVSPSEAGPDPAKGGKDAERAAPPLPMYEHAGTVCLKYAHVFCGRRGLNILIVGL